MQALDELLTKNRMSQPTYEHLVSKLKENMTDLETQQRTLAQKIINRAKELEEQKELLRLLLANLDLNYIAGEVKEVKYSKNMQTLTLGLKATHNELSQIKDFLAVLAP
jgi:hypothetical protein